MAAYFLCFLAPPLSEVSGSATGDRVRRDMKNEEFCIIIEFSNNFSIGNIETLESVKSMAETNFKMCLIITIQGFHDKVILQIFCRYLQLCVWQ